MARPVLLDDNRLMRQISIGDANAFEELYRRHVRQALAVARRRGASPELAEEVVQEAFVKLFAAAPDDPAAWLYRVVRNAAIDAGRASRRRVNRERAAARPVRWFAEPEVELREVAFELCAELRLMADWLGLQQVQTAERGDLAEPLRAVSA